MVLIIFLEWEFKAWHCADIMHIVCLVVDNSLGYVDCVNITVFGYVDIAA